MLVLKSLADLLIQIVAVVCTLFYWVIIIRIILSWIGVGPHTHYNPILAVIYQMADTVLAPFQKLPLRIGMIDLSPIVAIIVLHHLPIILQALLYTLLGYYRV